MSDDEPEAADERAGRRSVTERFGELFERIEDAIVEAEMVDGRPVIREVNPAFERVFGHERSAVLGEPLNEVIVPGDDQRAQEFDRRASAGKQSTAIVRRETATGTREFLLRTVPTNRDDSTYSFGIYTDITEQRQYARHSQVVHRMLRHNLRNDLSVILTLADSLSECDDATVSETAETIAEHAEQIASLREETRPLERVLDDGRNVAPHELCSLCRPAVAAASNRDDDVRVEVPEGLSALAVPHLQQAVESLVENALAHAGDDPTVVVRAERVEEAVHVEVVDDGPGIPHQERGPVFENRDITQLQHGSGVGLWLVRWTAEACGGDLEYERTDTDLTVVRLVLPACE